MRIKSEGPTFAVEWPELKEVDSVKNGRDPQADEVDKALSQGEAAHFGEDDLDSEAGGGTAAVLDFMREKSRRKQQSRYSRNFHDKKNRSICLYEESAQSKSDADVESHIGYFFERKSA